MKHCRAVVLNCLELPTGHPSRKSNEKATFPLHFRTFSHSSSASCRDGNIEHQSKLQDELLMTTEHTEHTEKEPDCLVSSFRVFSVFRGSLIGFCTDRMACV